MSYFKKFYVSQTDENDCGLAALKMVLGYFGLKNIKQDLLENYAKIGRQGASVYGLQNAAKKFGLSVQTGITNYKELLALYKSNARKSCRSIVYVNKQEFLMHFYTLIDVTETEVLVADPDPDYGIIRLPRKLFEKEWQSTATIPYGCGVVINIMAEENQLQSSKSILNATNEPLSLKGIICASIKKLPFSWLTIIMCAAVFTGLAISVSSIVGTMSENVNSSNLLNDYGFTIIIFTLSCVMLPVIRIFEINSTIKLLKYFNVTLLEKYIKHVFKLPIKNIFWRTSGDFTSRFDDINRLTQAISSLVGMSFINMITFLVCSIVSIKISLIIGIILLMFCLFQCFLFLIFRKKLRIGNARYLEMFSHVRENFISRVEHIQQVKSFQQEEDAIGSVINPLKESYKNYFLVYKNTGILDALKSSLKYFGLVLIVITGFMQVQGGVLSLGNWITLSFFTTLCLDATESILNIGVDFQYLNITLKRLETIFDTAVEKYTLDDSYEKINQKIALQVNDVTFSYDFNSLIDKLTVNVKSGDKVAITGSNGVGKSTLLKLIAGFLNPDLGQINLYGNALSSLSVNTIRKHITYLDSTWQIIGDRDLRSEIDDQGKLSDEKLINILKLLDFDKKLEESVMSKNALSSNQLSSGQIQKVALAKSLVSGGEIVIWDEATSSISLKSESTIMKNLTKFEHTLIVVTHKPISPLYFNQIINLDKK